MSFTKFGDRHLSSKGMSEGRKKSRREVWGQTLVLHQGQTEAWGQTLVIQEGSLRTDTCFDHPKKFELSGEV
jgi:hypothetical protein